MAALISMSFICILRFEKFADYKVATGTYEGDALCFSVLNVMTTVSKYP